MTLAQLKAVCAAYHQKDVSALTSGTEDLFLIAANNVRRNAEQLHDFEYSRVKATLTIDSTSGGALADATILTDGTWEGIKSIVALQRANSAGVLFPIPFASANTLLERDRYELELSDETWPLDRYPSDAQILWRTGTSASIVQRGGTLFLYPTDPENTNVSLTLEAYAWLPEYDATSLEATDPVDYLVQYGFRYMQYAIICELNYYFQTFVPRQEGVLAPPEQAREAAWRDLLLWDEYLIDPNSTRSR